MSATDDLALIHQALDRAGEVSALAALARVETELARLKVGEDAERIAANAERDVSDEAAATWATLLAEAQIRAEAAEAEVARLQDELRNAAKGEEHSQARARSDNDLESATIHGYCANQLRMVLAGSTGRALSGSPERRTRT